MSHDFWDEFSGVFAVESAIDHVLQDRPLRGASSKAVQALTDKGRAAGALSLPVTAGTRVSFVANLGSVLTYDSVPEHAALGTVVTVRSANGDVTCSDDRVMVAWDDGEFRPILADHLRLAAADQQKSSAVRQMTANVDDLSTFFGPVRGALLRHANSDLVHKATKDIWSFRKEGDQFIIERLFDEAGKPLKV